MVSRRLEGKSIVVTGAGSGLGRAYAEDLTANGAHVVVNDVDAAAADKVAAAIRDNHGSAVADPHSVDSPDSAAAVIACALDAFGRIDGLVNNAGIYASTEPQHEDPASAERLIAVNLLGSIYCGLAAVRHFVEQGSGVIVNDTSGAMFGMLPRRATYGASKGATATLTYCWAVDLAPYGIRVNAISPLAVTGMVLARRGASVPDAPTAPPSDVAPLVTYLMSDDTAGVTGQVIRFDATEVSVLSRPGVLCTSTASRWDHETLTGTIPALLAASEQVPPPAVEIPPSRGAKG